jgi:hypothetical protein
VVRIYHWEIAQSLTTLSITKRVQMTTWLQLLTQCTHWLSETALRRTRKREALREVSWNALPMFLSRDGDTTTPASGRRKKRIRTDGAGEETEGENNNDNSND